VTWDTPPGARVDATLVSEWIDARTLIVGVPEEWANGYPQRVELRRVRLLPDGTAQVDSLTGWSAAGNDRGIELAAVALSPDGAKLAVRVRHFTGSSDAIDVVEAMRTDDLLHPIELARGPVASGVSWSPNGTELAFAVGARIAVSSWTGANLTYLPLGSDTYTLPVWVSPNEIWLTRGIGSSSSIVRVIR
jgi:hypothetical protein